MRLFLTQNFSQLTLVNGIRRSGIGRDLLVSSHAGTRLPIAVIQAQGAPPQPATEPTVDAHFPPFCPGVQNQETPVGMSPGHNGSI